MAKDQDPEHEPLAAVRAPLGQRALNSLVPAALVLATLCIQTTPGWASEERLRASEPATATTQHPADDKTRNPAAGAAEPGADGAKGSVTPPEPGADDDLPRQAGPHPPIG